MSTMDLDIVSPDQDGLADAGARSVYERLRADIIAGHFPAGERLKVHLLTARYGVSINPVREALHQLRGEGFVIITPNRGARVRPIDERFFHDTHEIATLIEPYFTRWFVGAATQADIEELENIQRQIEAINFGAMDEHSRLDTCFHRLMYERHPNRHLFDIWWNHRDILSAMARNYEVSLNRRAAVMREHRAIIASISTQDADGAAAIVATHVEGSGKMWVEQMRSSARRIEARSPRPADRRREA